MLTWDLLSEGKHHMVSCSSKLPGQTGFRSRPPAHTSTQNDDRLRWKYIAQHLPSIAAQSDLYSSVNPTRSDDRSEPALRAGSPDKSFRQRNWIRDDVGRQEPDTSA